MKNQRKNDGRRYIPRIVPRISTSTKIFVDGRAKAMRDRRALDRVEY